VRAAPLGVLVALATLCAIRGGAQQLPDSAGRVTFRVLPETVTVGQPFELRMTIVPPAGRIGIAPAVPDTGGIIEPLDPAEVTRRGDTLRVRYRLLAWQTGVLTIPLGPVLMRRDSSDISVSGDMRVVEAHDICDRVEAALKSKLGDAIITIHVEPEGKAKHSGVLVL